MHYLILKRCYFKIILALLLLGYTSSFAQSTKPMRIAIVTFQNIQLNTKWTSLERDISSSITSSLKHYAEFDVLNLPDSDLPEVSKRYNIDIIAKIAKQHQLDIVIIGQYNVFSEDGAKELAFTAKAKAYLVSSSELVAENEGLIFANKKQLEILLGSFASEFVSKVRANIKTTDKVILIDYLLTLAKNAIDRKQYSRATELLNTAFAEIDGDANRFSEKFLGLKKTAEKLFAVIPTTITTLSTTSTTATTTTLAPIRSTISTATTIGNVKFIGGSRQEKLYATIPTKDNGYILVGTTQSRDGDLSFLDWSYDNENIILCKISTKGVLDPTFGDKNGITIIQGEKDDFPAAIIETSDGGYALTGYTYSKTGDFFEEELKGLSDVFLIKLTKNGKVDKNFSQNGMMMIGGGGWDTATSLIQDLDGNYLIAGHTYSDDGDFKGKGHHGFVDSFVIKLKSNGIFDNSFGKNGIILVGGSAETFGYKIVESRDRGYLLSGTTFVDDDDFSQMNYHGRSDIFVMKLTNSGRVDKSFYKTGKRLIGGKGDDRITNFIENLDGSMFTLAQTNSTDGDMQTQKMRGLDDAVIIKLNKNGDVEKSFGKTTGIVVIGGSKTDIAKDIKLSSDGGLYLLLESESTDGDLLNLSTKGIADILLFKLKADGNIDAISANDKVLRVGGSGIDSPVFFEKLNDSFIVTAFSESADGDFVSAGYHGLVDLAFINIPIK